MTKWKTKLIQPDARAPQGFQSLAEPIWRGSTVVFPNCDAVKDEWNPYENGYSYGLYGTPTTLELAERISALENGFRTIITPGGQSAISMVNFALLQAGDHLLLPECVYGPSRQLACNLLRGYGIESSFYPPGIGAEITAYLKPNTKLVWCESPGSITMEVEDLPAVVKAAHAHGALVAIDNTWAAGVLLDAFGHGVDLSVQALTKYVGGHSDLLLGSITARNEQLWKRIGDAQRLIGFAASPDDCALALRGLKTLAVRLHAIEKTALDLAVWLAERPEVERVLHPALSTCPGHQYWKRDFTGASGVFSFVVHQHSTKQQVRAFVDALRLFKIGYSWAGVASLAMTYDLTAWHSRAPYGHRIVRLSIGLEDIQDLRDDLVQSFGSAFS